MRGSAGGVGGQTRLIEDALELLLEEKLRALLSPVVLLLSLADLRADAIGQPLGRLSTLPEDLWKVVET